MNLDTDAYTVLLLGDAHYDAAPEVYHARYDEPDERLNRIQRAEFARNAEMWRERGPRLLAAASRAAAEAGAAFAVQTGDLVQGDCGDPAVHEKMLRDVFALFRGAVAPLPFFATPGNHDVRGPGADEAAARVFPEETARSLGRAVPWHNISFRAGPDLWLLADFNHAHVEELEPILEEAKDVRHFFFVTHGPLVPSDLNGAPEWIYLSWRDEERRRLRARLEALDAIAISGHTHTLEWIDTAREGGRLSQLVVNGVWESPELREPDWRARTPADYGSLYAARPDARPDVAALLAEYRPSLRAFRAARAAGFALLRVGADGAVSFDWHGGADSAPSFTIAVRHPTRPA